MLCRHNLRHLKEDLSELEQLDQNAAQLIMEFSPAELETLAVHFKSVVDACYKLEKNLAMAVSRQNTDIG